MLLRVIGFRVSSWIVHSVTHFFKKQKLMLCIEDTKRAEIRTRVGFRPLTVEMYYSGCYASLFANQSSGKSHFRFPISDCRLVGNNCCAVRYRCARRIFSSSAFMTGEESKKLDLIRLPIGNRKLAIGNGLGDVQ